MKKITATLIAGLFATAAFAQTPAAATTKGAVQADAKTAVLVNNKDLKAGAATKETVKVDTMQPTAVVKPETKDVKTAVNAGTKKEKTTTKAKAKAAKSEAKAAPATETTTNAGADVQSAPVDTTATATPTTPTTSAIDATSTAPTVPATPATPAIPVNN